MARKKKKGAQAPNGQVKCKCAVCGWRMPAAKSFISRAFSPDGKGRGKAFALARRGEGDRVCGRCAHILRGYEGIAVVPSPEMREARRQVRVADYVAAKRAEVAPQTEAANPNGEAAKKANAEAVARLTVIPPANGAAPLEDPEGILEGAKRPEAGEARSKKDGKKTKKGRRGEARRQTARALAAA